MTRFYDCLPEGGLPKGWTSNGPQLKLANELRENKGKWALYPFCAPGTSSLALVGRIKANKMLSFPADEFEAEFRNGLAYVRRRKRRLPR